MARIGRNQPCPCGSGRKHKKCCGGRPSAATPTAVRIAERPQFDGTYLHFRVTLRVEGPPTWRRFLLRGDATFADLHAAVQDLGWTESHDWRFADASGTGIAGRPDDGGPFGPVDSMFAGILGRGGPAPDATTVALTTFFQRVGDACVYTYDFGDNWEHDIELQSIEEFDEEFERALIAGEGVFPPEDCGGVPGWGRLVTYHETGRDPWEDPESLGQWLEQDPFAPFDLDRSRRRFGAVRSADAAGSAPGLQIDGALVGALTSHAREALQAFVSKVGLDVRVSRASYNDVNARFEVEVSTVREDGVVMNRQAEDFLNRCEELGLRKSDLGREFSCGGERLRIVGLRPRAKAAVVCQPIETPGSDQIRMTATDVRSHLLG